LAERHVLARPQPVAADPRRIDMRIPGFSARSLAVFLAVAALACSPSRPSATPPPPPAPQALTITGQVTEPAADFAPVEGANVCWGGTAANPRCAQTGADGTYVLVTAWRDVPPRAGARLGPYVYKGGFENRQSLVLWDGSDRMHWSPGLQRILEIEAGRSLAATVYPQEGAGLDEGGSPECDGCKQIRIAVPHNGMLTLRLTADAVGVMLLAPDHVNGMVAAPFAVQAGVRVRLFVSGATAPTRFELSTSLEPER
jgi:hypothetical protein